MKNWILLLVSVAFAMGSLTAEEKQEPGPNGGLLLKTEPRAEFFVNKDRKVVISFLDDELKEISPGDRTARVTVLAPSGRKALEFEPKGSALVSEEPLPDGDGYTIVAQIFETPDARPQNYRVVYEEHICGGCDLAEYACICGH